MAQAIPETTKQWNVVGTSGFDLLKFSEQPVPELGDNDVLVRNGAGIVLGTGKRVTRFKPGDEVLTILNQSHIGGSLNALSVRSGLGGSIDGTFREIGAFNEQGLVHKPNTLDFVEASTLSCSGLTARNALYGISDKKLMVGQWLLTQGTGGVSLFALQLAKATGARVIATTSSSEKAEVLRRLGADFVINYRETPNWGERAKELTGGIGVDHVVEVVGPSSMAQSLASIKIDGVITIIGVVGG
ncbi:alcohol dehydrogenase [Ilyonectria robusta]